MVEHADKYAVGSLWAVVLAGGEGVRLRPLVREICGDERPKQFAKIVGSRSLLGHTLDRVALKIPTERTVIVACRAHREYMAQEFAETPRLRVLEQPEDRGTAAGILFPSHWIHSKDPEAFVAMFPSDHLILEGTTFMSHISNVAAFVRREPGRLVLFGATASAPDTEYGWIEPGETIGQLDASSVMNVNRFWEKPSEDRARACLAEGCLWNTLVFVAKASTLLDIGRQLLPELTARLAKATRFLATDRVLATEREYRLATKVDFSRTILEACPPSLAVSTLPGVTWSDLGTPPKVRHALQLMASTKINAAVG